LIFNHFPFGKDPLPEHPSWL